MNTTPQGEDALPASVRNAPDLGRTGSGAPGASASGPESRDAGPGAYRREVTAADFQEVAQLSTQVPVVFSLWAGFSEQSVTFTDALAGLVDEYAGQLLLASVDVEKSPEIGQMFQAQSLPTVVALLGGRPVPMFNTTVPLEQVREVLDELLALARENGVVGTVEPVAEEVEVPLPPLHQEAVDALDRGDLEAAASAYTTALSENPGDHEAKLGLRQVHLLQRVQHLDARTVRERAAAEPASVEAQLEVADLDLAGGHVEDAFARLLGLVSRLAGEDRNRVRERLVELFDVVGAEDPRVVQARQALMRALF